MVFEGAFQNIVDYTAGPDEFYRIAVNITDELPLFISELIEFEETPNCGGLTNTSGEWREFMGTTLTIRSSYSLFKLDQPVGSFATWTDQGISFPADTVIYQSDPIDCGLNPPLTVGKETGGIYRQGFTFFETAVIYQSNFIDGIPPDIEFGTSPPESDRYYQTLNRTGISAFGTVCGAPFDDTYRGGFIDSRVDVLPDENIWTEIQGVQFTLSGEVYEVIAINSVISGSGDNDYGPDIDPNDGNTSAIAVNLLLKKIPPPPTP